MIARARPIFDGAHLRAYTRSQSYRCAIVTFDYWRQNRSGFPDLANGERFLSRALDFIRVDTARNDWFINADLNSLRDVLAQAIKKYEKVIFLGFSMGATGALLLRDIEESAGFVAISPSLPVRKGPTYENALPRRHGAGSYGKTVLVYDSLITEDRKTVKILKQRFPNAALVDLKGGGHPATNLLVRRGLYEHALEKWLDTAGQSVGMSSE